MLKENKFKSIKNDYDIYLWKYSPFQIIQKFQSFFWWKFFK
jgi:hypothetical protein